MSIGHGTVLAGRFQLEDLIHDEGGARFWRATDRVLARNVAVNVVPTPDPRAEALLSAARTSATVTEGHFLRVLDAADEDGVSYVVHEWGHGVSLDKMLADGPLAPRRAAWVVKEVAEAISTAHAHGVAHGRLVPENVMVTEAGSVKLIGFVVDAVLSGDHPTTDDGQPISEHEADVRNLAALLYAGLVAKWPGTPESKVAPAPRSHGRLMRARQVRAGVPRTLDQVCEAVLNPDAPARLETAHEVGAALSDFVGDPTSPAGVGFEPTSVLDRDELERFRTGATGTTGNTGAASPPASATTASTQAAPPVETPADDDTAGGGKHRHDPDEPSTPDPEETQAAAPVFYDDDSGVGWVGGGGARALRSDEDDRRPAPPPPPPFPEPEPRPLFAPGPARRTNTSHDADGGDQDPDPPTRSGFFDSMYGSGTPSSGGTGSLPPVWGPDADAPQDPPPEWTDDEAGKDWLRLAAIVAVVVVLVLAVIVAFNLGRGSDGEPAADQSPGGGSDTASAPQTVPVAQVDDFDPQGDPAEENPDLAGLAVDGDSSTAWETQTYFNNPALGLLKDGVGLVVDLGSQVPVRDVQLELQGSPTDVEVLAAPGSSSAPTTVDGLRRVGARQGAGGSVSVAPDQPVRTRYLVVWLTSLPPDGDGYKGRVAEITVRR